MTPTINEKLEIIHKILGHTQTTFFVISKWKCPSCGHKLVFPLDYNEEFIEFDSMTDICTYCQSVWQIRSL